MYYGNFGISLLLLYAFYEFCVSNVILGRMNNAFNKAYPYYVLFKQLVKIVIC